MINNHKTLAVARAPICFRRMSKSSRLSMRRYNLQLKIEMSCLFIGSPPTTGHCVQVKCPAAPVRLGGVWLFICVCFFFNLRGDKVASLNQLQTDAQAMHGAHRSHHCEMAYFQRRWINNAGRSLPRCPLHRYKPLEPRLDCVLCYLLTFIRGLCVSFIIISSGHVEAPHTHTHTYYYRTAAYN